MNIIVTLQNINGNYADVVMPDGSIVASQWYFPTLPSEHKEQASNNGASTVSEIIALKNNGIKIKYDDE